MNSVVPDEAYCGNCAYFYKGRPRVHCRRWPQVWRGDHFGWPELTEMQGPPWCGEWRAAGTTPPGVCPAAVGEKPAWCGTCAYLAESDKQRSHCRRLPPVWQGSRFVWPELSAGQGPPWCGEWRAAETTPPGCDLDEKYIGDCGDCAYFTGRGMEQSVKCRRLPPVWQGSRFVWPELSAGQGPPGCGEWRERPERDKG